MKQELVDQLIKEACTETDTVGEYGFTRAEVERLIEQTVDRCIVVMEREMECALEAQNAELYASLVDTAFKVMDEFGIDELGELDEEGLMRDIEARNRNVE